MNDRPGPQHQRGLTAKQEFLSAWSSTRESDGALVGELDACPYPGLRSFRPNEADLFFGRDTQIKDLRDLLADHNLIFVLGGSGSGKSSLVRAGLVPKLNSTAPIPDRLGAWYVVEFRPKLDPINELFDAMFGQLILPIFATPSAHEGPVAPNAEHARELAKERARRIGALNTALDLDCAPEASDDTVRQQCHTRLRDLLFEGNVLDVGALFDFVDERLRSLDTALAGGATSGAPNLLLLIDQFEEVFKPKVDPVGRDMIMSLINSIHTYKPFNLFLIVTMRSEELHRCSEFLGVTEVVNSSLYLVDLIGGRDIEQAIVGPARRVLKSWDLDSGNTETSPFTQDALSELHRVFDDGREDLPHSADQLPLMQHMLPLVWDQAILRWQGEPDGTPLQIEAKDIHALPGWFSTDGPLIGTLNARADDVLRRAIETGSETGKGLKADAVEQLLRVGFCCLAQLDDRGNVVRDFATIEQMLQASSLCERDTKQRQELSEALRSALGVFQRATLVNVGRSYDVNHEALIRGWKRYANWLKEARRRVDRLVNVDRMIVDDRASAQPALGVLRRVWTRIVDYILVEDLARADQIAGDETSADLQDVFGPKAAFSEQWARQALERADVATPSAVVHTHSIAERLGAVKRTINDAIHFREGAKYRPRVILASLLTMTFLIAAGTSYFWWTSSVQSGLNDQFRFFRLQSEATAVQPDVVRTLADDREVYAALHLVPSYAQQINGWSSIGEALAWLFNPRKWLSARSEGGIPEATGVFRTSLRQLDRNTRTLLSDVSVRILDRTGPGTGANAELAALRTNPSECAVVDPDVTIKHLLAKEPGSRGIELRPLDVSGAKVVVMNAVRRAADGEIVPVKSTNFPSLALVSGALVCLSHDANWFLMVVSTQANDPPYIQRIVWIRTDKENGWRVELGPSRQPASEQTWDNVQTLSTHYPFLNRSIRDGAQLIRSFRSGDRVGFLIALEGNRTAMLWTSTGLIDPDSVEAPLQYPVKACVFKSDSKISRMGERQPNMKCEMGPIGFDGLKHYLRADYDSCNQEGLCRTALKIEYDPKDTERESPRVVFQHTSAAIEAAAIWDDSLWVRDANGQVWRYLVGVEALKPLLEERWKGIDQNWLRNAPYSESCVQAKCDKMIIPGWPERRQESR